MLLEPRRGGNTEWLLKVLADFADPRTLRHPVQSTGRRHIPVVEQWGVGVLDEAPHTDTQVVRCGVAATVQQPA
jgi:hypothetical protein